MRHTADDIVDDVNHGVDMRASIRSSIEDIEMGFVTISVLRLSTY